MALYKLDNMVQMWGQAGIAASAGGRQLFSFAGHARAAGVVSTAHSLAGRAEQFTDAALAVLQHYSPPCMRG